MKNESTMSGRSIHALKTLKVLVGAFAFSPIQGTEFAIGWDHVRAIAARNRVWVIARTNEREETERYLQANREMARNITVRYVPFTAMKFNFPFWEVPFYRHYKKWQRDALDLARGMDAEVGFDLVHHITATGYREPGYLWKLGKPFVWGPLGGMQYFPVNLLNAVPLKSRPFFILKNVLTFCSMHLSTRPRAAAKHAVAILAGTSEAAERVRKIWGKHALVMNEVHAPMGFDPPSRRDPSNVFRIVWAGRFQPRKALNIVLMALERLRDAPFKWELICLGSGELESAWKRLASNCGIADRCGFLGNLPRAEALKEMAAGHCFAQPSLYDATSSVVVEALALGLPVVCLDHCGFRDVIDPTCGIRIPVRSLNHVIHDFARVIETLAQNEDERYAMAVGAQRASIRLSWKYKAGVLRDLYSQIVIDAESSHWKALSDVWTVPNSHSGAEQQGVAAAEVTKKIFDFTGRFD